MEKRLLMVLRESLAAYHDLTLGDLLNEQHVLHAFVIGLCLFHETKPLRNSGNYRISTACFMIPSSASHHRWRQSLGSEAKEVLGTKPLTANDAELIARY